ncbi:MAG: hypothetical protein IT267_10215 [Saprospiraceae bacterium]|nr:hypothetical protein [Saprospiraceae bacterium]
MLRNKANLICSILLLIILASFNCNSKKNLVSEDIVIAEACGKELKYSEVADLLYYNESVLKDSIKTLYIIAENWARDVCFIEEAKQKIGDSKNIDELVEKYRNSLYLDQYENFINNQKPDTSITEEEYYKYYQEKRGEYKLDGPIIKLQYVMIKKSDLDEKIFNPLWNDETGSQIQLLQKYCSNYASEQIVNGDKWNKWSEIRNLFPEKIIEINKLAKGLKRRYEDKTHYYYLKVFDLVESNQEPPLSFVKEQATRSILHIRKTHLLEDKKSKIFEQALKSKSINIFVK